MDRVKFYENGVVSLNLPPVGNVLGTRASRTTHPQSLNRFGDLFGHIFGAPLRIDNPFFWRTKTDVVTTIARLGMADQIAHTRSCADVHNQTKQYAHCGRCSQCIDRRFAVLAAKLERYDPEEAYRVDLMAGARPTVQDKEIALSYVRMALGLEVMTPIELEQRFPEILSAVDHLDEPPATALSRLADLLRRHGASVAEVMREAMRDDAPGQFPEDSLPYMFGALQRGQAFGLARHNTAEENPIQAPDVSTLVIDRTRKTLLINERIEISGATFQLLLVLGDVHLKAASEGRELLDYPFMAAGKLCDLTQLETEEALRRRVLRARTALGKKFSSAGLDPENGRNLIETLPRQGYRLAPDRVTVRMAKSG
jgi:queuosine biosynthesis protein QueC